MWDTYRVFSVYLQNSTNFLIEYMKYERNKKNAKPQLRCYCFFLWLHLISWRMNQCGDHNLVVVSVRGLCIFHRIGLIILKMLLKITKIFNGYMTETAQQVVKGEQKIANHKHTIKNWRSIVMHDVPESFSNKLYTHTFI